MSKKKKKTLHGLDKYVIFSISAMIIYTITVLIILCVTGYTDSTLTTCFFGFFGGEIVTCALIKIFKLIDVKKKLNSSIDVIPIEETIDKNLP